RWHMELRGEERALAAQDRAEEERVDGDGAEHHERKARIPAAEEVEEGRDLGGGRHAGEQETGTEQEPGEERCEPGLHERAPIARRRATVRTPVAMNASVATRERFEKRLRPQTPCPLVQPEPSCVPKPTSSPAPAMRSKPGTRAGDAA